MGERRSYGKQLKQSPALLRKLPVHYDYEVVDLPPLLCTLLCFFVTYCFLERNAGNDSEQNNRRSPALECCEDRYI